MAYVYESLCRIKHNGNGVMLDLPVHQSQASVRPLLMLRSILLYELGHSRPWLSRSSTLSDIQTGVQGGNSALSVRDTRPVDAADHLS